MRKLNLIGQHYGRLLVLSYAESRKGHTYYNCLCSCGKECVVDSGHLRNGHTTSCGCFFREDDKRRHTTHGKSKTRLHQIFYGMYDRCYNENNPRYKSYGGRGIKICDTWKNNFIEFYTWAKENGYADNLTIERVDNNAGYSPENCRWITMEEQAQNKRNSKLLTFNGETHCLAEWGRKTGLSYATIRGRVRRGWPIDKILTTH